MASQVKISQFLSMANLVSASLLFTTIDWFSIRITADAALIYLVDRPHHFTLTHEQDPGILKLLHLKQDFLTNTEWTLNPFPAKDYGL